MINISQHTFVPFSFDVSAVGNKRSYFIPNYRRNGTLRVYPNSGDNYTSYFSETPTDYVITTGDTVPILPWRIYDRTEPKEFVLVLY